MTRKEERELVKRIQGGDMVAREKLITSTMKFAKYIAKDYVKEGAFFERDDLLQECYVGLVRAVDYIAKTGLKGSTRFISYANKIMRNQIRKNLKKNSYIIKHSQYFKTIGNVNKLVGAITHFYDNTGFNFITPLDHTPGRLPLHNKLLDILDEFLTLEEEDIIMLKYGFGHVYFDTPDWQKPNKPLTREKIAKILSCTVKRVKVREEKAMEKLQTPEVQLKLIPWL